MKQVMSFYVFKFSWFLKLGGLKMEQYLEYLLCFKNPLSSYPPIFRYLIFSSGLIGISVIYLNYL